ncbi:unnamed protein product [Bemisia tabaci]|uniref:Voltage-dependent calcium channel gamma-5 subunit n=1 Tax=Bemisia tabaci TaxID=7038 RepID=A0A9P0G206_BEMTA|nr:unnamed protein product [Bemisia tabaci]
MCCGDTSSALSRTGILIGLISVVTLVTAFVSNVWLFTKEPILLPNSNVPTTVSFKIGLWRVCPSIKRINNSQNLPSPACTLIKYSNWEEIRHSDLGIWTHLDFTPAVVTRMRLSTPFEGLSLALMILATFYAVIGHCNSDKKTLVACALYTLAGLCLAGGLLIFASVLSDAFFGLPHSAAFSRQLSYLNAQSPPPPTVDYRYGWSFFAAGAAFILTEIAAVFAISAYLRRYRSVEEMVSIMVPGARRKLCEITYAQKILEADVVEKKPTSSPLKTSDLPPDICPAEKSALLEPAEAGSTHEGSLSGSDADFTIKIKPVGKYTLNSRSFCKAEHLPQCGVKCAANANRFAAASLPRQRASQRAALELTDVHAPWREVESPSSSGSSVPEEAPHCDCRHAQFRSLPRRKGTAATRNSLHSLAIKCENQLPILPESALARDL